ncbi:uncharacterized protein LOC143049574 [Mytilus galloprovincialis]|uniref:uncharacterized protein LOC143049574 n=1 Tax=Mytilus galloprovincialis TaxID=29158 RepID=UPI003F7CAB6B
MISREKYKNDNTDDKIGTSLVKKKQEKFIKGIEEEGINDHPDDKFQCGSCKDNVYGGLLKIIEHRKNCTARVDKRELTETTLPVLLEVKNLPKSNENRFKQEGKQNSGSLDNDVIEVYDADLGSLILWTKISKACFLSRKTFGNTFQNFFAKVLREHPLDTTVETDLTVTVHILDDFCDLESDDLEGDVYQCGICEDKFTRLRSFMNHKKDKCSRKPKLVSEMSFRNKLMEGLPEEEFSRVTKERKDKGTY